jgi:HSP90 family molecular chaperone
MSERPPWTKTDQASEEEWANWLRRWYTIAAPTIIVPPFKFSHDAVEGTGLLFVPQHEGELPDRMARIDLWLNGQLVGERLDGFLPPWYQFTAGVLDVTWPDAPAETQAAISHLQKVFPPILEDRLTSYLQEIEAQNHPRFRDLLARWMGPLRSAAGLTRELARVLASHLEFKRLNDTVTLADIFFKKTEPEPAARSAEPITDLVAEPVAEFAARPAVTGALFALAIHVSLYVDPDRFPYRQIFEKAGLEIIDARDPDDYMLLQSTSRNRGAAMVRADTRDFIVSALRLKPVSEPEWATLVDDFRKSAFSIQAEAYAMDAALAPAVYIPTSHEDADIASLLESERRSLTSDAMLPFKERGFRQFRRQQDSLAKWTLLLNTEHPLIQALRDFVPGGTARRLGINHVEYLARMNAKESVGAERQEQAWRDIEELLKRVDELERQRGQLEQQSESLRERLERQMLETEHLGQMIERLIREKSHMEREHEVVVGHRAEEYLRLERELEKMQEQYSDTQQRLAATQHDLGERQRQLDDTEHKLGEALQELEALRPVPEAAAHVLSEQEAIDYLLHPAIG